MLFYLTGDIQTGKTRWLTDLADALESRGVCVAGVLAPGVWREVEAPEGAGAEEPAGESANKVELERGTDPCSSRAGASAGKPGALAAAAAALSAPSRGSDGVYREKLGIDNLLLPQRVRIPFARRADLALAEGLLDKESQSAKAGLGWIFPDEALRTVNAYLASLGPETCTGGFLIIDELGRLELTRGEGLTEALRMVDAGPTEAFPHVLAIVRESLLPRAHERFDAAWAGAVEEILPTDYSKEKINSLYPV